MNELDERKRGTLRSGGSGQKVTSRKQAIAIGLSEARQAGGKVPKKPALAGTKKKSSGTRKSGATAKKTGATKSGGTKRKSGGRKSKT